MAEESIGEFVADYVLRDQVQEYFEHHWSKDCIHPYYINDLNNGCYIYGK